MYEAQNNPADAPLVIWLTGGPGCSSTLALLSENGPCRVNADGKTTTPNDFSWNNNANVLWLDQPAGVGFSYGTENDDNEEMIAEDAYYFVQSFLQSHPEYATHSMGSGPPVTKKMKIGGLFGKSKFRFNRTKKIL